MKRLITLCALLTITTQASEEFRSFTAKDGRQLKARVLSVDGPSGKVSVLREDGSKISVKMSAFSELDRAYLREWIPCSLFLKPSKFVVIPRQNTLKSWRNKHESEQQGNSRGGNGPQGPGGPEESQGGGGGPEGESGGGSQVIATDKNTKYRYDLSIANRSGVPLKNLRGEYRMFYTQERPVAEKSAIPEQTSLQHNQRSRSNSGTYYARSEDKIEKGTLKVGTLEMGDRLTVCTTDIVILERNASNKADGEMIDLDGELRGIWIKIYMPAPGGGTVVRDIIHPRHRAKEFKWES